MKSSEKFKILAQQNGWSLPFANGYADGEITRKRLSPLPIYMRVAMDEYAEGFRAAYYGRRLAAAQPPVQLVSVEVARAA